MVFLFLSEVASFRGRLAVDCLPICMRHNIGEVKNQNPVEFAAPEFCNDFIMLHSLACTETMMQHTSIFDVSSISSRRLGVLFDQSHPANMSLNIFADDELMCSFDSAYVFADDELIYSWVTHQRAHQRAHQTAHQTAHRGPRL